MLYRLLRFLSYALCFALLADYAHFDYAFLRYFFLGSSWVCMLYWCSTCTFDHWKERGVVTPVPVPFFGNIKDVAQFNIDIGGGFKKLYEEFPDERFFGVYQTLSPTFVVRDPELIKRICVKDFQQFTDRGFFFNKKVDPLGENILFARGADWKKLRARMSPTFSALLPSRCNRKVQFACTSVSSLGGGRLMTIPQLSTATRGARVLVSSASGNTSMMRFMRDLDPVSGVAAIPQKMRGMLPLVTECGDALVSHLKTMMTTDGTTLEAMDIIGRYTTDAIVKCAFSLDCDSLTNPNNEFKKAARVFYDMTAWNIFEKFMRAVWPSFVLFFRIRMIPLAVHEFFTSIVTEVLRVRENTPPDQRRGDLIDSLLQLREESERRKADLLNNNPDGKDADEEIEITDNLITANAFLMFLGGYETTQSTITFCLCALSGDMRVQDLVREELVRVLPEDGIITKESLDNLKYLEMVLQETLRLYPIFQNIQRLCTKDYKIPESDVTIEKGMIVIFPTYGIQRDPKYFADPEKFQPERFSEENKANILAGTYMPFGDGPRYCIGQRFAMVQMKVGLAKLLMNFKVSACPKTVLPTPLEPRSMTACPGTSFIKLTPI